MPSMLFSITRVEGRYPNNGIVCDFCFRPLWSQGYYVITREGTAPHPYPLHTVRCAENWINRNTEFTGIDPIINRCSDEHDDTQEEITED